MCRTPALTSTASALERLAEAAGLDAPQLSRIEAGRSNITFRTFVRLANGLGLKLHALIPR